jgi:hypothetical protein
MIPVYLIAALIFIFVCGIFFLRTVNFFAIAGIAIGGGLLSMAFPKKKKKGCTGAKVTNGNR